MPQYYVGHLDRVRQIEQMTAPHPRLAVAGNAYNGVGIPDCISSGERAAERVFASLGIGKLKYEPPGLPRRSEEPAG